MSRHGPSCQPRFDVTEVHFAKGPLKQGCGFGWIRLFWSNSNVLIRSGFQRKGWSSLNIKIQNPYKIKFFSSIVSLLYKRGSFVRPLLGHIWSFFEDRYWIRLFFKDLSRIRVFFYRRSTLIRLKSTVRNLTFKYHYIQSLSWRQSRVNTLAVSCEYMYIYSLPVSPSMFLSSVFPFFIVLSFLSSSSLPCPTRLLFFLFLWLVYIMVVLILDGNSEHDAHAWRKIGRSG